MSDVAPLTRPTLDVWERRRIHTMRDIQQIALDLFERYGYRNVTIERVAGEAGLSPSTIYRYFGTKETLVVWDEYDPQIVALLRTAGEHVDDLAGLFAVVKGAGAGLAAQLLGGDEETIKRRMRLIAAEPDVRAGQVRQTQQVEIEVRDAFLERFGGTASELDIRLAAAQASWGFLAAVDYWVSTGFEESLADVLGRAVDRIARGISCQFDDASTGHGKRE